MAGRSRHVIWTPAARDSLDEALAYIASDSPQAAGNVLDVVLKTAESLAELSERGRIVPELAIPTIREVFVYSYRLIYEVREAGVEILAFIHGARDFDRWMTGEGRSEHGR